MGALGPCGLPPIGAYGLHTQKRWKWEKHVNTRIGFISSWAKSQLGASFGHSTGILAHYITRTIMPDLWHVGAAQPPTKGSLSIFFLICIYLKKKKYWQPLLKMWEFVQWPLRKTQTDSTWCTICLNMHEYEQNIVDCMFWGNIEIKNCNTQHFFVNIYHVWSTYDQCSHSRFRALRHLFVFSDNVKTKNFICKNIKVNFLRAEWRVILKVMAKAVY